MPGARKRCPSRRELYIDELDATRQFLATANADPRVQTALTDPGLIDALDGILQDIVTMGVAKDLECLRNSDVLYAKDKVRRWDSLDEILSVGGAEPTGARQFPRDRQTDPWLAYQRYFAEIIRPDAVTQAGARSSGIEAFYARYPLLRSAVARAANNFRQNLKLACARVVNDWNDIAAAFAGRHVVLTRLNRIDTTGNDFHKGGKQVLILTFTTEDRERLRVVYKPSSVEIDCRLVGDSAVVNQVAPQGYQQKESLTELVNALIGAHLGADTQQRLDVRPLPTYRILPYDRDSIPSAYGYIEYLTHEPAVEASAVVGDAMAAAVGAEISRQVQRDKRFVDGSDWITKDRSDTRAFHFQFGALMAVAASVSLCDLHVQNLIVHGRSPYLIDLEEALKKPMSSILDTYLPFTLGNAADPVGKHLVVTDDQTPELTIAFVSAPIAPSTAVLYRWQVDEDDPDRARAIKSSIDPAIDDDADTNRRNLVQGTCTVFDCLATDEGYARVCDWVRACDRTIARYVPRATSQYADALRRFYLHCSHNELRPLLYADSVGWNDIGGLVGVRGGTPFFATEVRNVRRAWMNRLPAADPRRWNLPTFAVEHPDHAWRDYLNGDVPSFYRRLGERDLRNSAGDVVDVRAAVAWQKTYIQESGDITDDCGRGTGAGETMSTMVNYFPTGAVDMTLTQLHSNRRRYISDKPRFLAAMLDQIVPASAVLADAVQGNGRPKRRGTPKAAQKVRVGAAPAKTRRSRSARGGKDDQ